VLCYVPWESYESFMTNTIITTQGLPSVSLVYGSTSATFNSDINGMTGARVAAAVAEKFIVKSVDKLKKERKVNS